MLGAVGDVVHTLPVVAALKRDNPARRISWILQPGPASLLQGHPDVDEIIVFRRSAGLRGFTDLRRELSERAFDITLAMQSYLKAGIITAMTRAPIKLGYDRQRARDLTWLLTNKKLERREERHHQDQFLEFAQALGVNPEPLEWNLGPWPNEVPWREEFRNQFDRPIASIVIGASRVEREWFADRWARVITSLHRDFGLAPVLVGGRSSRELATEQVIIRDSNVPVVSTLGESFRRLVSILDVSSLVLSINTGPMHMAVAMNKPTISLNGFGNPKRVDRIAAFMIS